MKNNQRKKYQGTGKRKYVITFMEHSVKVERVFHVYTIHFVGAGQKTRPEVAWISDYGTEICISLYGKKKDFEFQLENDRLFISFRKKPEEDNVEEGNSYETEKERESNFENGEHYTF